MSTQQTLKLGLAQIAPVWLNRAETTNKIVSYINKAADQDCDLYRRG